MFLFNVYTNKQDDDGVVERLQFKHVVVGLNLVFVVVFKVFLLY